MEINPTSQVCQISSWQSMWLLSFRATERHAGTRGSESVFLLLLGHTQEKSQPEELCLALEGVSLGTKHHMKTKCKAEKSKLKLPTDLQLSQEHFYFCTIVHLIYPWHQHIKYLSPALLRIPRYREQPISVFELFLVPKNLWLQNMYPHKSSTSGC